MRIGVISDTHGMFDHTIVTLFDGVDAIIHAGDIGKLEVISRLEQIAPVIAVEGNNDWFNQFPTESIQKLAGHTVLIRHIFGELHQLQTADRNMIERVQPDIVVFGHSHRPYVDRLGRTMLFNPGSAGPRRFSLPRTVGLLSLAENHVEAEIIRLD
ncbi:MAG TPA: metallophosphoesterase family protein [Blastocatellia bacterium]|nr:metallophosphoesterase family protein [Blastocatellia bacterium]